MNHCQICHSDIQIGIGHLCGGTPTPCPAGGHVKVDYQRQAQLDRIEEMLKKLVAPSK